VLPADRIFRHLPRALMLPLQTRLQRRLYNQRPQPGASRRMRNRLSPRAFERGGIDDRRLVV